MVAPAADGFYQVFRLPLDGGALQQLTTDRSNKSQPAFSPDGGRLAYTVWSYDAHFFSIDLR
jgi:Tol biopolymer transport system component